MTATYSHDFDLSSAYQLFDRRKPVDGKYGRLSGRQAFYMGFLPAKVFLDDVEIADCVEFDDVEGWADIYDRCDGGIVVNETGDGPRIKRLHGIVRYEPYKSEADK